MATGSVKPEVIAQRPKFAFIAFAIAAVPALFLPFSYLYMVLWAGTNLFPQSLSGHYSEVHPIGISILIVSGGLYATYIQWPVYLLWAALSPELNWRLKMLWIVILIIGNMFTIPWFLYCKYNGTTKTTIINSIKIGWLRQFFEKAPLSSSQYLDQTDYRRQHILLFRGLIIMFLLLSLSAYWNLKFLIDNIYLRSVRDNWAQLAGTSLANRDFSKGQIHFYQIGAANKADSAVNTREGYPVKAWAQESDSYQDAAGTFVDNYNKTMLRLIEEKDGTHPNKP